MKTRQRWFATFSVAAVIAGLSVPITHAGDYKVFPGTMCRQFSGGNPRYDSRGRLYNASTISSMMVSCPIVRDNETGAPGFQVIVIDMSNEDVSCQGVSSSRDGSTQSLTALKKTSPGYSAYGQPLNLGGTASQAPFGSHYILCTIPQKYASESAITSYVVWEP